MATDALLIVIGVFTIILPLVISFLSVIMCNVGFTMYHLYMSHDSENQFRLLNVFHAEFAIFAQIFRLIIKGRVG